MAEIRSTLDIIMEKAKEVDVTEADRIAFKKQDAMESLLELKP